MCDTWSVIEGGLTRSAFCLLCHLNLPSHQPNKAWAMKWPEITMNIKWTWRCISERETRHILPIRHSFIWGSHINSGGPHEGRRRFRREPAGTDMLKTTALWGKNNKYSSLFPHTHVNTLNVNVAFTENTNRCGVTCHSHRKTKPSAWFVLI